LCNLVSFLGIEGVLVVVCCIFVVECCYSYFKTPSPHKKNIYIKMSNSSTPVLEPTLKKKKTIKKPIVCDTPEDRVPYKAFDKLVARSLPETHRGFSNSARNKLHNYLDSLTGKIIKGAIHRSRSGRRQGVNFTDVDHEFTNGLVSYVPKFNGAGEIYKTFLKSIINKKQAIKKKRSRVPNEKKKKKKQVLEEEEEELPSLDLAA
jgi:histone H3/H4